MRKHLLTIPIDYLAPEHLERRLKTYIASGEPHQITTVNPEFVVLAQSNEKFKEALTKADLSLPDGTGIVLAQTLADHASKNALVRLIQFVTLGFQYVVAPDAFAYKRITGVELSEQLMALAAEHGWKVYLLGAKTGVAAHAGDIWKERYPRLTIVGASPDDPIEETAKHIRKIKPDILLVAYGAPKQDVFIHTYKEMLSVPVMVGVGGTFDYATGGIYRAPKWMRRLGLEWLARLIQQPKRFKRIWRSTVGFTGLVIKKITPSR